MGERPRIIDILVLLWLALSAIFVLWGIYSLVLKLKIPSWSSDPVVSKLVPELHFGYLIATIVFFVFSALFIVFAYATFREKIWAWTSGIIISTILLAIFSIMLTSFMINAIMFFDWFSVNGLVTVVISFITDLGIIFFLTRPATKQYFKIV